MLALGFPKSRPFYFQLVSRRAGRPGGGTGGAPRPLPGGEDRYITVDAVKTAQSYVDGQKLSCAMLIGGSLAVLAAEGGGWLLWRRRRTRQADAG